MANPHVCDQKIDVDDQKLNSGRTWIFKKYMHEWKLGKKIYVYLILLPKSNENGST